MRKIQSTFEEGDDVGGVIDWVNDVIWAYTESIPNRDPAEYQYILSNKIRIKVEICGETNVDVLNVDYTPSTFMDMIKRIENEREDE